MCDCFAYKEKCIALTVDCEYPNCKFYKSVKQANEELDKVTLRCRAKKLCKYCHKSVKCKLSAER